MAKSSAALSAVRCFVAAAVGTIATALTVTTIFIYPPMGNKPPTLLWTTPTSPRAAALKKMDALGKSRRFRACQHEAGSIDPHNAESAHLRYAALADYAPNNGTLLNGMLRKRRPAWPDDLGSAGGAAHRQRNVTHP